MPEDIPGGDMSACMNIMQDDGHDEEAAAKICEALRQEAAADNGDPDALREAIQQGTGLVSDVSVDLNSAVDVPAVDSEWVMMKSEGDHNRQFKRDLVMKQGSGEEKRISYAPAMIPRETDKEGDVVPTSVVERAAHDYLKNGGEVDTDHNMIEGKGEVIESWIEPDSRTWDLPDGGEKQYPPGTWMVGIKWNAETWDRIKSGELTGLSIYGMAEHVPLARSANTEATCAECGEALTDANRQDGDTSKSDGSESGGMGDETDTDGGDGGGDGPTIGEVASSVSDLRESVESIKEAMDTEKQDNPQDAAAMLADELDMSSGDVMDILNAASEANAEADDLVDAVQSAAKEDGDGGEGDDEGEDDEEMDKDADAGPDHEDAHTAKGYDGEGTREQQAKDATGGRGGSAGIPSYRQAAENREAGE